MNALSGFKYCITLRNSKRDHWKYFFKIIFRYLSPWLAKDLDIVISYIGITIWQSNNKSLFTLVKRVYGAWELVCLPLLSFSIHNKQRQVNIAVFFNIWLKTVNNCDIYCIYNLNNPPIMFFVPNITFSGVRIFTRNIYFNCTDISDTRVQMFLRTNDKNN